MAAKSGLERRGAVYYWRRRIPQRLVTSVKSSHFRICLRTKEPREARFLAARLESTADEVFMVAPVHISNEALKSVFVAAFEQHKKKLQMLADYERGTGRYDAKANAELNWTLGQAYQHLARFGIDAPVQGAIERKAIMDSGVAEEELPTIWNAVDWMREQGVANGSLSKLRGLLEQLGIDVNAASITAARPVYLRALGEALLDTAASPLADPLPFSDLVKASKANAIASDGLGRAESVPIRGQFAPEASNTISAETVEVSTPAPVKEVGEKLVHRKIKDKEWDTKTVRQARSIFDLFSRFLNETNGTDNLYRVAQKELDAFNEFLLVLKKTYGKSPSDRTKSIAQLRSESRKLPEDARGLAIPTRNRHYTNLGLLLKEARKAGRKWMDPDLDISEFRGKDKQTARQARAKPQTSQVGAIFHSPIFMGCEDWESPHLPGEELYHGALYYGTMIGVYNGPRREEYCGLLTADVVRDNGPHPYFHITFTDERRIKNKQSVRNIAVHPELIRLGFIEYVEALEALGHDKLFPDLYSPSTTSPMGDRFYDKLKPILRSTEVTPHMWRHYFNNTLKQAKITEEVRADLLGHLTGSETADRYCDPLLLENQLEVLAKLPILTDHLKPTPVRLIPWVERKEIAPWSRAAKIARRLRGEKRGHQLSEYNWADSASLIVSENWSVLRSDQVQIGPLTPTWTARTTGIFRDRESCNEVANGGTCVGGFDFGCGG